MIDISKLIEDRDEAEVPNAMEADESHVPLLLDKEKTPDIGQAEEQVVYHSKWRFICGVIMVSIGIIDWIAFSEILQFVEETTYDKPYFLSYTTSSGFILSILFWLMIRAWRRIPSCRRYTDPDRDISNLHEVERTPFELFVFFKVLVVPAFITNVFALIGCYIWYISLKYTEAGVNNTIYQSQVVFVYILGALFLPGVGNSITMKKNIGVVLSLIGVALIAFNSQVTDDQAQIDEDHHLTTIEQMFGIFMTLLSALMQAISEICVQFYSDRYFTSEESLQIISDSMFLQFLMGVINTITMWPIIVLLNGVNVEKFEVPSNGNEWLSVMAGILLDLVFTGAYFSGISLTSALFMGMASLLVVPMTYLVDVLYHNDTINYITIIASLLIVIGFVFVEIPFTFSFSGCRSRCPHRFSCCSSSSRCSHGGCLK